MSAITADSPRHALPSNPIKIFLFWRGLNGRESRIKFNSSDHSDRAARRKPSQTTFFSLTIAADSITVLVGDCRRSLRSMQTDAISNNIVTCWLGFLANNVASVCMDLKVWPVSNYMQQMPTSDNIVVVSCKRTQHVGPNNVACCWPTMLRPFAWAFTDHMETRL